MMIDKRVILSKAYLPWLGLLLSLLMTATAWLVVRRTEQRRIQERFVAESQVIRDRIIVRIKAHEQLLLAATEFVSHDRGVPTRQQWKRYVQSLDLNRLNPGVQALAYAEWIPLSGVPAHVARLRAEGFPDYEVRPGGPLPPEGGVSAIVYIEPFDPRNQQAFSKDMFAEATRREAMAQARDSDEVTLSRKVKLFQEGGEKVQAGTLLYAAAYRPGLPLETVTQRREALLGWAYMAFRMDDLLAGILGDTHDQGIHLELFEGDAEQAEARLYADHEPDEGEKPERVMRSQFQVAGRTWTLKSTPSVDYSARWGGNSLLSLFLVGACTGLGMFLLLWVLLRSERQATHLADERLDKLQTLLDSTGEAIYGLDLNGHGTFFNPACLRMLGYASDAPLLGKNIHSLIHHTRPDGSPYPMAECSLFQAFRAGVEVHIGEEVFWRADGSPFPVECWSYPQRSQSKLVGAVVTFLDITARKEVESELKQVSERLALATQAGGVGVWDYDVVHNALRWDEQMYRLYGISATRFSGVYEAWRAGLHPDDAARGDAEIQQALLGEKEFDTEFRVLWPDGSVHDIRALAQVQRDAEGRPLRMVGTNWDITEPKQAGQRHLETEERLAHAMAATGDGIWDWDIPTGLVKHNARWCQILGLDEGFLEHPLDFFAAQIYEEDRPRVMAAVQACLEGRKSYHSQHRMLTTERGTVWVLDRGKVVAWDAEGRPLRVVGSMADITAQKAAEMLLAESEAQFRGMFEGNLAPQLLFEVEAGMIRDANPAAEAFYGYTREQFRMSSIGLLNGQSQDELEQRLRDICAGKGRFESRHRLADGSLRWMEVHASPIQMKTGTVIYAILHDITDRKQVEASLLDLNQTLEVRVATELEGRLSNERALVHQSRLAAMGEMVGNIAHQWRQPLNALSMVLANLHDAHRFKELTDERFAASMSQGGALIQKMTTTITDFMDFFRPAKEAVTFSVRQQVLDAVALVAPNLGHHQVVVELLEGPEVIASGFPNELSQVILNLLANARDAIQGSQGIQGIQGQAGLIRIEVSREGDMALLRLSDNGGGIPVTFLERIFEPYFTSKATGTGLGLYMSKVILEQSMKGSIAVRNIPGGAEFSLTLPLAEADHAPE